MEALLETKIFKVSVERLLLNGGQTLYMVGIALLIGTVIGTLLALVLVLCRKGGLVKNKVLHSIVSLYINVVRSVPFIILLVTVTVGPENALYSSMLLAEDMNWISIPQLKQPMRVKAKTRYRQAEQWAAVYPEQHGRVRLEFDVPQRAVTVGQAVVLYDGDVVVGGGTICQAPPTKR